MFSRFCLAAAGLFLTTTLVSQPISWSSANQISRSSAEIGIADVDGDGFNDLLVSSGTQRWYKGPEFTTFYDIGVSDGGPYAARVADMNDDGFPDFVTSDGARNEGDYPGHVYLYLHPGALGDPTQPWERIVVYTGNVRHQNDMRLVDVDGDGRLDIIEKTWSTEERVLISFQNADINDWTTRTFNTGETGLPEGISAGDIDGDGQTEIIQSGVYWDCAGDWRTDPYTEYTIDAEFYDSRYSKTKSEVGDINDDGKLDVYIGSAEGNDLKLSWYENLGNAADGSVIWSEHLIKDNFGKCHVVELEDIDLDGDLDLFTGRSFGQDGVIVFYNEDDGAAWTEQNFAPNNNMYTGQVGDLDGDGDMDVAGPLGFNRTVQYYYNLGQAPPRVAEIMADPQAGTFPMPVSVTLSTATPAATIYYTLDNTVPTQESPVYTEPIVIQATSNLRAVAFAPDLSPSTVLVARYVIDEDGGNPPSGDDDLLAYWPFDEPSGSIAPELVNAKDATLSTGAAFRESPFGNALFIDGNDSRAEAPPIDVPGDEMSITAWIRPADLDNVEARIVSKASGTSGNDHDWMVSQNGGSALRFRLNTGGATTTLISPTNVLVPEEWTFVAAVYDGLEMRLYRDGEEVASLAKTGMITQDNTIPVAIGNQPAGAGDRPFSGLIDEVKIYGRALSAAEITEAANALTSLPVELLSFTGRAVSKQAALEWSITERSTTSIFILERSSGSGFSDIAAIPRYGNAFTYLDRDPAAHNVYRLRMLDADGSEQLSPTVELEFSAGPGIFPSPATDHFFIRAPIGSRVNFIDPGGRIFATKQILLALTQEQTTDWQRGLWLVEIVQPGGERQIERVLLH